MKYWLILIESAKGLDDISNIIEQAAFDETITNKEYETVYQTALEKVQNWNK